MQKSTQISRGIAAAAVVAAVLSGACASSGRPSAATGEQAASAPQDTPAKMQPAFLTFGWNRLISMSQAGVVATVIDVGPVRWNSLDGKEWVSPNPSQPARKYRDVRLRIKEAVFSSPALQLAAGQEVTIRSLYAADDGTKIEEVEPGVRVPSNKVDGELVAGNDAVLLLAVWPDFPTQIGKESVTQIVGGWQGNWSVNGDQAENVAPRRSMALQSLIARFLDERAAGRQPSRDAADRASLAPPPAEPSPTTTTTWPTNIPIRPPATPASP